MADAKSIWRKSKANVKTKIKIYRTLVKSVLIYNYDTWALTKRDLNELDRKHRRQLRSISPGFYKLSNVKLYEICKEKPISKTMKESRWRIFGHLLRLPLKTPCQKAMQWFFENIDNMKKYRGRPRLTLPKLINQDLVELNLFHDITIKNFETLEDLYKLYSNMLKIK